MLKRSRDAARAGDPRARGRGRLAVPRARDRHPRRCSSCCRSRWRCGSASPTGTATAARSARTRTSSGSTTTGTCSPSPGLDQNNFGTALRNNFYYVLLVVPIQTAVALFLAVLVNRRIRFVGFFRTAFYFPSVTSSVAITILFLFLFSPTGAINKLLSYVGVTGPVVALRPARPLPRHPRPVRRRPAAGVARRTTSSSASATGTGWPARASPCASSS